MTEAMESRKAHQRKNLREFLKEMMEENFSRLRSTHVLGMKGPEHIVLKFHNT
jgi:hypothetical protein